MAQTYVSSHNAESYTTRVSVIWNMPTSEHMCEYEKVPSVSTCKGTDICEFAQHRFIYKKSIWYNISMFVSICMYTKRKCKHSQGHKHMWVRTAWVHIEITIHDTIICILIFVKICIQRGSKCERSQWAQTSVRVHSTGWHTNVSVIWFLIYVYLLVYVCIQRRSRCEHSQGYKHMSACTTWVMYKIICDGICILVSTCIYVKRF